MWTKKATEVHNKMAATIIEHEGHPSTEMKIEHITYDEAQAQRPRRREEVTEKIKIYISHLSCGSEVQKMNSSGTLKSPWSLRSPWTSNSTSSTPKTPKTPWDTRSQWSPKEWRQSLMLGTRTTVTAGPIEDGLENKKQHMKGLWKKEHTTMNTTTKDTQEKKVVGLRKKDQMPTRPASPLTSTAEEVAAVPIKSRRVNFRELVKDKWTRASRALEAGNTQERGPSMEKIQALRKKMAEGKMEKVIRPLTASSYENGRRLAPPPQTLPRNVIYETRKADSIHSRSSTSCKSNETSRSRCHSRNRKTKSSSSTLASLLDSGAEALDSTRRELQEKFKPPLEHLSYHSFSLSRKASQSEAASSVESFYCMGYQEDEQNANNRDIRELKRRQSGSSRVAVMDPKPWALEGGNRKCRLCGRKGVARMRNLCGDCEKDFLQRREQSRSRTPQCRPTHSNEAGHDDEIKPVAPLRLILKTSQSEILRPSQFHEELGGSDDRSPIPQKGRARRSDSSILRTPTAQPKPHRPSSQYEDIDIGAEEMLRRLQKCPSEDEFERAQSCFKRWSQSHASTALEEKDREEGGPSTEVSENRKDNRDTGFYEFWDNLLGDFQPKRRSLDDHGG